VNHCSFEAWLEQLSQLPGAFMTGTDTGVGKTWIGTRLLQHLQRLGVHITPRKPVESGWLAEQITETDTWKLATNASGFQPLKHICPNPLLAPLSPPRAAQLEGKTLSIQHLAQQCLSAKSPSTFLYVEGAGGFYSPLAHDGLNADLAAALQLPIILVSEDRVGCINHILLTTEAIRARKLSLAAVILNPIQAAPKGMDNQQDLQALLDVPVFRWEYSL
jgi:dethiobiotin synthetase